MKRRRTLALTVGTAVAALVLAGCASAQQAIDQAQGAVDSAQELVDSAASVTDAPQALSQACETALAGLAPGTPTGEAEAALSEATAQLDEALGLAGNLPIVSDLRDALVGAAESLVVDTGAAGLTSAREAIDGVCGALTLGGSSGG